MSIERKPKRRPPRSKGARAFDDFTVNAFLATAITTTALFVLWLYGVFPVG